MYLGDARMIIDWEHHYLPEALWRKKGGEKGKRTVFFEHGKPRGNLHPELYDVEKHLALMNAAGIDLGYVRFGVTLEFQGNIEIPFH